MYVNNTFLAALQAQFQNRAMYGNGNMMANTPQALMFQQQQQAAMAMNRGSLLFLEHRLHLYSYEG